MEGKNSSQEVTSMFLHWFLHLHSHNSQAPTKQKSPKHLFFFFFVYKLTKLCSLLKLLFFLLESSITGEWIFGCFWPSLQLNTKEILALVFKSMWSDNIFSPACPCQESVQLVEMPCLSSQHHKIPLPKFICRRCHFSVVWRCIWWQRRMKGWWKQAATRGAATWAVFLQSHRASCKPQRAAPPRRKHLQLKEKWESSGLLSLDLLCLGPTALQKQE